MKADTQPRESLKKRKTNVFREQTDADEDINLFDFIGEDDDIIVETSSKPTRTGRFFKARHKTQFAFFTKRNYDLGEEMKTFFQRQKLVRKKSFDFSLKRKNLLVFEEVTPLRKPQKSAIIKKEDDSRRSLNANEIELEFSQSSEVLEDKSEKEEDYSIKSEAFQLSIGGSYRKVRLELDNYTLVCYDKKPVYTKSGVEKPQLVLNFNQLSCGAQINKEKTVVLIKVLGFAKNILLKCSKEALMSEFCSYLIYFITNSTGYTTNLVGLTLRKEFYKEFFYSEDEFLRNARTGDVLVFRGNECVANCQRFYTRDQYDHVALVVRKTSGVYFYESLSVTVMF